MLCKILKSELYCVRNIYLYIFTRIVFWPAQVQACQIQGGQCKSTVKEKAYAEQQGYDNDSNALWALLWKTFERMLRWSLQHVVRIHMNSRDSWWANRAAFSPDDRMISLETSRHTQNREDSRIEIRDDLKSYNREVRVRGVLLLPYLSYLPCHRPSQDIDRKFASRESRIDRPEHLETHSQPNTL